MSFYRPYLEAHPQVQPKTLTANGVTGFGFGGPSYGRLGRISAIAFGGETLHEQIADFSTQTGGALASPFVAANLGGNMLRRWNVTFDYRKQTMALVRNAAFDQPDTYERSGMFLLRKDGKVIVIDARPGTPAADAGIVKGDVLETVDGVATSGLSLEEVRSYFFKPAGTRISIGVASNGSSAHTVTLTLRDYV